MLVWEIQLSTYKEPTYGVTYGFSVIDYRKELTYNGAPEFIYIPEYAGLFKSIGSIFKGVGSVIHSAAKGFGHIVHEVGKGAGKVIHEVGKGLKYVAPIAVPLIAGAAITGALNAIGATYIAKASAASVAAAVESGSIGAAVLQSAALATKVALTNIATNTLMHALGVTPQGEPVVVQYRNRPALVIPAFVRELVEPSHLVAFATENGRITVSRTIQARIDWLANKIQETARRLGEIARSCGVNISRDQALAYLKRIFWFIPPTKAGVEQKINSELSRIKRALCCTTSAIRRQLEEVFLNLNLPPSPLATQCLLQAKNYFFSNLNSVVAKVCSQGGSNVRSVLQKEVENYINNCIQQQQLSVQQQQQQQQSAILPQLPQGTTPASTPNMPSTTQALSLPKYIQIGQYKIPTMMALFGGLTLLLLLTRR